MAEACTAVAYEDGQHMGASAAMCLAALFLLALPTWRVLESLLHARCCIHVHACQYSESN